MRHIVFGDRPAPRAVIYDVQPTRLTVGERRSRIGELQYGYTGSSLDPSKCRTPALTVRENRQPGGVAGTAVCAYLHRRPPGKGRIPC